MACPMRMCISWMRAVSAGGTTSARAHSAGSDFFAPRSMLNQNSVFDRVHFIANRPPVFYIFLQARPEHLFCTKIKRRRRTVMSLKKQYLKRNSACKVTFSFPKQAAGSATHVNLVGDFNSWNKDALPMKRLKNGAFTATVTLESNKEYHFRYFLDGQRWENDWNADKYVPNSHGSDDSVVVL